MDYSKVKYVKPSVDGLDITKDKVYEFEHTLYELGLITDDSEVKIHIYITECPHLKDKHWIPCTKDGTPL